ncbi:hypothetical protein SUGI_1178390 [Cryptomeria japonica]|uniref:probable calcium-binding protein CML25 n=1 Tax=Cryptomeria japonica TaxID=3369 RepID=UPI002414A68E|nr:probable calcium-binding protein CML25 [Cryptomeria japonica]GLJ54875.1 hypothetical protein SUGI_1178390 [Cryptomeria japonica]
MGFSRFLKNLFNCAKPERKSSSSTENRVPEISVSNPESLLPSKKELEVVFKTFDINGDGKISWSEVGEVISYFGGKATEEELQLMVKAGDLNGDGLLDFSEFMDLNTKDIDLDRVLRDMEKAFDLFDLDGNGSISADELQRFFRNLGEKYSLDECQRMIDGVDCDGDGSVNFQEFMIMMTKPSGLGE